MELTDEQVEMAAKTAYGKVNFQEFARADSPDRWENLSEGMRETYRKAMRIGAPFLQIPLDNPTQDEILSIASTSNLRISGLSLAPATVQWTIYQFIMRRNASLLPKPVDPRRAKIARAMDGCAFTGPSALDRLTDAILAALDAKE